MQTIDECKDREPKQFWQLLNNFRNRKEVSNIQPEKFISHFQNLNTSHTLDPCHVDLLANIANNHIDKEPNLTLNEHISLKEITNAIKTLKCGKSASDDMILNEMLKCGVTFLTKPLEKLFNCILKSGIFPKAWKNSLMVPIHKKGPKSIPSNYRGISLTSCLSKLFSKV